MSSRKAGLPAEEMKRQGLALGICLDGRKGLAQEWGGIGFRGLGGLGFRGLGFRGLGSRGFGFRGLGFRVKGIRI